MNLKAISKTLISSVPLLLLAACGSGTPAPEPVLMSQFNQNSDRFGVVSTVGKAEGTIQKSGRSCDIYKIYTTGLTAGGRAAMKAGEIVTSVATLGLAQVIWAPVKAGTRPQLHTVLFCFGSDDKLVDIYDKDPTDSTGPDHLIINRAVYNAPVAAALVMPAHIEAEGPAPVTLTTTAGAGKLPATDALLNISGLVQL
ncbi:MAG: hypothetical protein LKH33_08655 [Acetobacter sp.]|jgi:hypothetical protein|nr:hypothetical protein [Acetobacter sp.]MCI1485865.1 hypothetical protein [Acetobacter sp.]MCI1529753.1 hypothetical protein [Acetobacter sp.]MCI1587578.1 hypothetical protein [Acetobacter sp.]MCI1601795.1 hypothetical protein [Acetobacter sp.]